MSDFFLKDILNAQPNREKLLDSYKQQSPLAELLYTKWIEALRERWPAIWFDMIKLPHDYTEYFHSKGDNGLKASKTVLSVSFIIYLSQARLFVGNCEGS